MAKATIPYTDYFKETIQRMREDGLLLVTCDASGTPNVMTIGWGAIGSIWGRPAWLVLVRPSRHTHSRLEEVGEFTVNVPPKELAAAAAHCGKVSGRDHDKFQEMSLTAMPARQVRPPVIAECVVHYECRVLHRNDLAPQTLAQAVHDEYYPEDNFHRIYYGEIVASYAEEDAARRLGGPTAFATLR